MRFYNRENEINSINELIDSAKNKSILIIVSGRRRIGKTRLINEVLKKEKSLSFFIPVKEKGLVLKEFSGEIKHKLGYSPDFNSFESFLEYIFTQKDDLLLFFDEFQNMGKVDSGFFYSFQKHWDKWKDKKRFLIFISGSYIGTIKKIFQDKKAPLYGRSDAFFKLKPLSLSTINKILLDLRIKRIDEQFKIYGIFGGIPRYYEFLENIKEKSFNNIIKSLFINEGSILVYEGKNILIEELGKKYKVYFSILETVASGKNTIVEIANSIQQKPNTIVKYLSVLEDYYEILKRKYPVTEKKSKKSRYYINDYFLLFWFRFIQSNKQLIEENRNEELFNVIQNGFNQFFGRIFERIILDFMLEESRSLLFEFKKIGSWWHKDKEIDIIALNEQKKEILFAECKWQDKVNAEKVINELSEKSKYVDWNNNERKESFAIFAKSFSKRIKEFNGKKVYCFDLKDIGKIIKSKHQ